MADKTEHRILFAGTPDISVPLLRALASRFNVVGVLTSCDKSQGRSSKLVPTPVKAAALELGIPVIQSDSIRTQTREEVKSLEPDTLVTFAFGRIFGPRFLALFSDGTFNVHPSALPLFRGPSPIQATIREGLKEATISVQTVGLGMDEGDIWGTCSFALDGTETDESLTERVSLEAAAFVPDVLASVFGGKVSSRAQVGEASYCTMIAKEDGKIDFNRPLQEVHAQIRTMYPWPKAYAYYGEGNLITIASVWGGFKEIEEEPLIEGIAPGTVVGIRKDRGIGIACSDKVLWVTSLQLPAKKMLDFKAFANGNQWILRTVLN